jgi:hypothetical protein
MPLEVKDNFIRERVNAPNKFLKGSFRTLVKGEHRIVVGCPKTGKCKTPSCSTARGLCPRGMRVQTILHPKSELAKFRRRLRK